MKLLDLFQELTIHPKNAEELKGLILQLAIQGKLTKNWREQNQNVEPASTLLSKITAEKEALIKAKKIKKEKPLPEIPKDEIPFRIPEYWDWERLANISSINGGFAFKSSLYVDEGVRVVRISDFDEKGFKSDKIVRYYYSEELADYLLEEKNILMAMTGGTVGKTYFVRSLAEKMVVNQRVATIKLLPLISEKYINCVIQTRLIKDVVEEAKNSTNDNISMSDIKNFFIPVPPLEEQKAIVEIVEQLFKEVEALEEQTKARVQLKEDFVTSALAQLTNEDTSQSWSFLQPHFNEFFTEKSGVQKLRESILQLAVQGKLTKRWRAANPDIEPASTLLAKIKAEKEELIKTKKIKKEKPLPEITEEEIPYELPDGWVWCRMQEVGLFERGKSKHRPRNDIRLFSEGTYPLVQTGDVSAAKKTGGLITTNKTFYNDFGLKQSRMWPKGTLCITIAANIAETGILNFDACFPDSVVGFTTIKSDSILSNYIEYFITVMKSDLEHYAPSTAQKNINLGILYELKFPFPPLDEVKAIVEMVNTLMALCDQLEQAIEEGEVQIQQLMQSCLREVFE